MSGLGITAFIFFARVVDVSLQTVRTVMIVRGRRWEAALISFVEILIFIFILGLVMSNLDNYLNMVSYAAGFAMGCVVGSWVEERLALGYESVQVIPRQVPCDELVHELRENGFGVTVVCGHGRSGARSILFLSVKRRDIMSLMRLIEKRDPLAFVTVFETRKVKGGVFRQRKGK